MSSCRLKDVPETMLWTLHNRASESLRSDGVITDKKAEEIYRSIDYDYERSFGKADPSHALRSLVFDQKITQFLEQSPEGVIVNLGEGLETQRFRVCASSALWLSVDLPESIEIRERYIQPDERHVHLPLSVMDTTWFDSVPKDKPVFITAQGLFMYFEEADVMSLFQAISKTFDNCRLMFDAIPEWLSRKTTSEKGWWKTPYYRTPKMPWGINRYEIPSTLRSWLDRDVEVLDVGYPPFPRGVGKWLFLLFCSTPVLRNLTPAIVQVRFH